MTVRKNFVPFSKKKTKVITGTSRTKQSFKKECDINVIVSRAEKTGMPPNHVNRFSSFYGDVSNIETYKDSLELVMAAQDSFMGLPSRVRDRFANDPAQFIEFMSNPQNAEEMVKLGLATRREIQNLPASTASKEKPKGQGKGSKSEPKEEAPE